METHLAFRIDSSDGYKEVFEEILTARKRLSYPAQDFPGSLFDLTNYQLAHLLNAADELGKNTLYGLGIDPKRFDDQVEHELDAILSQDDWEVRLGILYNRKINSGEVYALHPIITGITPAFNPQAVIEERRQGLASGHRGGGLYSIQEGFIKNQLTEAGLVVHQIEAIDGLSLLETPGIHYRSVYFNFERFNNSEMAAV